VTARKKLHDNGIMAHGNGKPTSKAGFRTQRTAEIR
jgi:hypothetical protein